MAEPTPDPDIVIDGDAEPPPPSPPPEPSPPPPPGESRTTVLYRAALGPVNTARYLAVFARFDAAGRHRPLWHPAAGLCTLNWLVFRRLWTPALLYAGAVAAVLGLGAWLWPTLRAWPVGVQGGLLGSLLLLSVVLPGMAGYAWVHRDVRRRLLRVVAASQTMGEARAGLARQASSRQRLWGLVGANALLLAGLVFGPWRFTDGLDAVQAVLNPARDRVALVAPPVSTAKPALEQPASVVAAVRTPVLADAPMPTVAGPAAPKPAAAPLPVARAAPEPVPERALVSAPVLVSQAVSATGAATVASGPVAPPPAAAPVVATKGSAYGINVGLFADEGNARRAHERLQQAGLPATLSTITTAQGPRSRVRVGPFQRRGAADEAAQRIHALGLEAVVFTLP